MMRTLFTAATVIFWLAVGTFWVADRWIAKDTVEHDLTAADGTWTLAQIAGHDRPEDCWMAIDGAVFDLTSYLPRHPSNPAIVLPWCGKDATQAYHTKTKGRPHSSYADRLLSELRIGTLKRP
ncbi:cytochrome B5 [Trinickia dabaoshanensis]|uniref:Cytochrome B5 n=1 Tax=Trinickia dabaoshanensis TaxID=564714 RepID=A0A2N7W3G7_9BURK|nr:cytochrome b5 domain-containing protein [Trinickia dabaoshanensis]PMS23944.1 cytochrome B5 [Trinickia dabaoshanensis]